MASPRSLATLTAALSLASVRALSNNNSWTPVLFSNLNAVQGSKGCSDNSPPFKCLGNTTDAASCADLCIALNDNSTSGEPCSIVTWSSHNGLCWTRTDSTWEPVADDGVFSACDPEHVPKCAAGRIYEYDGINAVDGSGDSCVDKAPFKCLGKVASAGDCLQLCNSSNVNGTEPCSIVTYSAHDGLCWSRTDGHWAPVADAGITSGCDPLRVAGCGPIQPACDGQNGHGHCYNTSRATCSDGLSEATPVCDKVGADEQCCVTNWGRCSAGGWTDGECILSSVCDRDHSKHSVGKVCTHAPAEVGCCVKKAPPPPPNNKCICNSEGMCSNIPSSGDYFLTSFCDSGVACGGFDGNCYEWYSADSVRFGCGSHISCCASGKACVSLKVIDAGPACFVEDDAGGPVIDGSYAACQHFTGSSSCGYSDHVRVHCVKTADPADGSEHPRGPCSNNPAAGLPLCGEPVWDTMAADARTAITAMLNAVHA